MIKNRYKRIDYHQAFDEAIEMARKNPEIDYREIAKNLNRAINKEMRLTIAAKAKHLLLKETK